MIYDYQNIQKNSTETTELQIQKNVYCGPVSSVINKIAGLVLSLLTIALGTTQVILSSSDPEKKDFVKIGFGSGFIVLGIFKVLSTIFDYCLSRKQGSQVSSLAENLNVKSGVVIEKDKEIIKEKESKKEIEDNLKIASEKNITLTEKIELIELKLKIASEENVKLKEDKSNITSKLKIANKKMDTFDSWCTLDYVQDAIKKAKKELKTQSSNVSSGTVTPRIMEKKEEKKGKND
jgi:hypothetical protein